MMFFRGKEGKNEKVIISNSYFDYGSVSYPHRCVCLGAET